MKATINALSLDIVIATYNRSGLLRECLDSIFRAATPTEMAWRVTVVDNNSSDDTRQIVDIFAKEYGELVRYLFEEQQGKSAALNCGISQSDYSLIGFIDDDEQIDEGWLETIQRSFLRHSDLDFIGGPYFGLWRTVKPIWLPCGYNGVLGADNPAEIPEHSVQFPDPKVFLRGGNAVIRRSVFDRIGQYAINLGPIGNGFASCEDHEFLTRMLDNRMRGSFIPDLVIYHVIPPERVTRSYYRKWAWGHSISLSAMDRMRPQDVPYIGRIPRYLIGQAIRGLPVLIYGDEGERFSEELRWRSLIGFAWGAYARNSR